MIFKFQKTFVAIIALMVAGNLCGQEIQVDRTKYPDANPSATGPTKSQIEQQAGLNPGVSNGAARSPRYGDKRPDHLNNALTKYFPPVINQSGGSCGSAQAVYYMTGYEMNAYRNTDASYPENQLPTHFTWLHTYCHVEKCDIINKHGVPDVAHYGGRTYSELFGNQDTSNPNYGWMQGYDNWYNAMFNRTIGGDSYCDNNQMSEVGREQLKQWLWNHWDDESFFAGGISGIGVASGGIWGRIPNTAKNRDLGVAGLYCVTSWGKTYDHALTIVGYDDRIEFDLDSNGVYGEEAKDEMGAWIIVNSWGSGWCNKGFIYCPYKYSVAMHTNTLPWTSGHYTWRKDYEPKRVFKVLMDYDRRSEIAIAAGYATDTSATQPEKKEDMPFFHYAGDGTMSTPAPEVPMLGRWKSTYHHEPMEFGYDVTDLTAGCDFSKPIKYFLYIDSKKTAVGNGNVYKLSFMDYELEKDGLELPSAIDTVKILNGGQTTVVSFIVPGRQLYAPLNTALIGNRLTWSSPKPSSYNIARYYIYKGSNKVAEVPSMSNSFIVDDPGSTYYVAAAYSYKNNIMLSDKSTPARNASLASHDPVNKTLVLNNANIVVPNIMQENLKQATIEFWLKPNSLGNNSLQVGDRWGSFLFNTSKTGQILCGWDLNTYASTAVNTIKAGNWYHVALVVDYNVITIYLNGMKKGSVTSQTHNGIPPLSQFCIGTASGPMNAEIDEFRVWSAARTVKDIFANRGLEVANPAGQTDLLLYFPMATYEADGNLYLKDMVSGNDAILSNATTAENTDLLKGATIATGADFQLPDGEIYAGEPVQFKALSDVSAISWLWSAPGASFTSSNVINPFFTFNEAGEHTLTLHVETTDGQSVENTHTITVISPEAPKADFEMTSDKINGGEKLCLANKSVGANATYKWTLPGSEAEELNSVNASVRYNSTGTFPVTLTVTNAGGTDQMTKYVTVTPSAPRIAFSVDPSTITLGETTYLIDESHYNPTSWKWTLDNGVHQTIINGQNSSFTPTRPGVYDVTLEASNEIGTSTLTTQAKLMVINADSRNGLNFTGKESATTTASPFPNGGKAFTIEWWMNPTTAVGALNIHTANNQVTTQTAADGEMTITVGSKSVKSTEGYVVAGEWHHYAITYTFGAVKFYRDGVLVSSPTTRLTTSTTDWGLLTISGGDEAFSGQIDELRIWSKCQSLSTMKGYINAPLTDPEGLTSSAGLVAYYDFNQSGGSVKDRSANKIDLVRNGFGPDGDAWGLSKGVFTLDLAAAADPETIEADGLTHIYQSVAAGKTQKFEGLNGAIRLVLQEPETVRIYTLAGQCVMNDIVEGLHFLPFDPGVYIVNGHKVIVK